MGLSTEIFEIKLLRTWVVDIESRRSQNYAAYASLFLLLLKGKGFVCPMHGWSGNFRPEANWQYIDFDPFYTVRYGACLSGLPPFRYSAKCLE